MQYFKASFFIDNIATDAFVSDAIAKDRPALSKPESLIRF